MSPSKHYTEQPSELTTSTSPSDSRGVLHLRGGGFVTRDMVDKALRDWRHDLGPTLPSDVLVDLREVAGYESSCVRLASEWLRDAHQLGIRRIAFLATSSVFRIATRVASDRLGVSLRTFEHELAARQWSRDHGKAKASPLQASITS